MFSMACLIAGAAETPDLEPMRKSSTLPCGFEAFEFKSAKHDEPFVSPLPSSCCLAVQLLGIMKPRPSPHG